MAKAWWEETVQGGATWSHILKRKTALRITDPQGGASVSILLYNADNLTERYNMADTLKAQHTAKLTKGNVLMSDMGRILCSITEDTCGWHDPLGGVSNAAQVLARFGEASYQTHRNSCLKNGLDCFLIELGKHGLDQRDLVPNVNLFSKLTVENDGSLGFVPGNSPPGSFVELRAEMNTLVVLHTCPHPLDPAPQFQPKPVQLSIRPVAPIDGPVEEDDPCRKACEENARSFILTERYFL